MSISRASLLAGVAMVCLIASSAMAAPVPITNASFEAAGLADGAKTVNTIAGWTTVISTGGYGTFNVDPTTQDLYGSEALDTGSTGGAVGTMDGPTFGYLFPGDQNLDECNQTLSATLQANTAYTLTVAVGTRVYFNNAQVPSDFRIALETTGGTVVAEFTGDVINADPFNTSENTTGTITLTEDSFVDFSASNSDTGASPAGLGEQLVVRLQKLADGRYFDFDNIRLDATAVPEPASLTLVVLGGLAVLRRRRRRAIR